MIREKGRPHTLKLPEVAESFISCQPRDFLPLGHRSRSGSLIRYQESYFTNKIDLLLVYFDGDFSNSVFLERQVHLTGSRIFWTVFLRIKSKNNKPMASLHAWVIV